MSFIGLTLHAARATVSPTYIFLWHLVLHQYCRIHRASRTRAAAHIAIPNLVYSRCKVVSQYLPGECTLYNPLVHTILKAVLSVNHLRSCVAEAKGKYLGKRKGKNFVEGAAKPCSELGDTEEGATLSRNVM